MHKIGFVEENRLSIYKQFQFIEKEKKHTFFTRNSYKFAYRKLLKNEDINRLQ